MYDTDIKGKRVIYYENCLELDGVTIYHRDMEHITQSFEDQPVFRFGYRGRDIRIPCREDEYQTVLEYWIKAADQSPTTDTVAFLDSAKKKKEDDSRLDSFTEARETRYTRSENSSGSGSSARTGNSYTYNYNFNSEPNHGNGDAYGYGDVYGTGTRQINKHVFVWICSFFFGVLGVDRFARGQIILGLVKFFTGGLGGILWFVDFLVAVVKAYGTFRESDYVYFNRDGSYTQ